MNQKLMHSNTTNNDQDNLLLPVKLFMESLRTLSRKLIMKKDKNLYKKPSTASMLSLEKIVVMDTNGVKNDAIILKSCFKKNANSVDQKTHNCCLVKMKSGRNKKNPPLNKKQQNIFRKPESYIYIRGLSGLPTRIQKSQYDVYLNCVQYEI